MHVRTFYRQRRGDRTLAEASQATGINKGALSRIERGEQFPKAEQCRAIAEFYAPDMLRIVTPSMSPRGFLWTLYPKTIWRLLQLERNCACGCGRSLPPDSLRTKRYCDGHRKHVGRA